jgi:Bacterial Ig domain
VAIEVLDNDSDPDDDPLQVIGAQVTNGGGVASTDGQVVIYQPDNGCGRSAAVLYTITDGRGSNAQATISIDIDRPNRDPIAAPDSASTFGLPVTVNVIANDVDPDCDDLHLTDTNLVQGGGLVTHGGSSVTYTPLLFQGTAVVRYTVSDGRGGNTNGTFTIEVGNRAPNAVDVDGGSLQSGDSTTVRVIPPSSDPDGDDIIVVGAGVIDGAGSASAAGDSVAYTAPGSYSGGVTVLYTIRDSRGGEAQARVFLTVTAPPPPPTTLPPPPPPPPTDPPPSDPPTT